MKKTDAPRLKKFLSTLLKCHFGQMSGQDMVRLVTDMEWLAAYADKLEKESIEVVSQSPIEETKKKGKK